MHYFLEPIARAETRPYYLQTVREEILKGFFTGEMSELELASDLAGSRKQLDRVESEIAIQDMETEFEVSRSMLVSLCDAVLSGSLQASDLATIGFALQASDKFVWDGDRDDTLANVIADWSCPEVNYPLTLENIGRFRAWLSDAEPYPTRPSRETQLGERVISITRKVPVGRPHKRLRSRKKQP